MSDVDLFRILHKDYVNMGFLRSQPFLNPFLSITDLERPITTEQRYRFDQCRNALVIQAQDSELHKFIVKTPRSFIKNYHEGGQQPTKAVKRLNMDRHY